MSLLLSKNLSFLVSFWFENQSDIILFTKKIEAYVQYQDFNSEGRCIFMLLVGACGRCGFALHPTYLHPTCLFSK